MNRSAQRGEGEISAGEERGRKTEREIKPTQEYKHELDRAN